MITESMYISWKRGRASPSSRYAARRPYASTPSALPFILLPPMLANDLFISPYRFCGHDALPMHADLSRPDHHSARIIALTPPTHPVSVMTECTVSPHPSTDSTQQL
ncbi:hypothetical protein D9611_012302 [Ephemerocybe angulata]|uniref:Uncharacterized protein n=1 Tax=Ephemerocybe angulata TaxID=980116 RepID=A0A8H5ES95_9AGAR|nr:hypothetical protein D9611_012302 [Tulosesus angulatus]